MYCYTCNTYNTPHMYYMYGTTGHVGWTSSCPNNNSEVLALMMAQISKIWLPSIQPNILYCGGSSGDLLNNFDEPIW